MRLPHKKTRPSKDFPHEKERRPYIVRLIPATPNHPTRIKTNKGGWRILEYDPNDPSTHQYPGDGVPDWYTRFVTLELIKQKKEDSYEFITVYGEVSRRVSLGLLPQTIIDEIEEKRAEARLNSEAAA